MPTLIETRMMREVGHARDVDDVVAVEHADRGGLVDLGDEALEVRLGDLGQRQAGQERVAELEHARGERELPPVGAHVAEVGEREQEAPRGGAREPGRARDVAERERRRVGAERADDREPALQRLHEVGGTAGCSSRTSSSLIALPGSAGRSRRPRWPSAAQRRPRCAAAPRRSPRGVTPLPIAARTCMPSSFSAPSAVSAASVIRLRVRRSRPGRSHTSPHA